MSIEGQGHFFTIYFPGFICFVLDSGKISGERLQDHWSSGYFLFRQLKWKDSSLIYHFFYIFRSFPAYTHDTPNDFSNAYTFLYFLDNSTFNFKNTLEYVGTRLPGNTCQFS